MKLTILTPSKEILAPTEVSSLQAPGLKGTLEVLSGHADYAEPLGVGILSYQNDRGTIKLVATGGYLEVHHQEILVVADTVEKAEDFEASTLRNHLAQLESKLSQGGLSPEEFLATLKTRDQEVARLKLFD
ncbi:MAG: F0F1 ATP synthase subunit epsilon [Deltaproteobacteria bacterium]|nr:F0F1 ATP synthase subunit epsilon [Deltaproteobacteria bacterium]